MLRAQRVAAALKSAKSIARDTHIIKGASISRGDRELLTATGWLQEIMRGWYVLVRPDVATGDTAAWYANFWDFIRLYFQDRFGDKYCLSAESSLDLYTEKSTVPKQLVIIVHAGAGVTQFMHGTSLMVYVDKKNFPEKTVKKNGLNVMELSYALCKAPPSYFQRNPRDAELALRIVPGVSNLTRVLARYELSTAASRLAGAYKFLGQLDFSEEIQSSLKILGMKVVPSNPFKETEALLADVRVTSPYAGRIKSLWLDVRKGVEEGFLKPPGVPKNSEEYLRSVDEIYQFDAYNSLSIEGYQVNDELIDRVKNKNWHPDKNQGDLDAKNAMAARGYFDAFQCVKKSIKKILEGKQTAAEIIEKDLSSWYQALFGPSVQAGIIPADALFGYRSDRVFIKNSIHSPPPKEAVLDAMGAFFECLKSEKHPGVRAVLGHYFFVYIHPYMDGNGRIGRFIMNALLAEGGYPWTVIQVKHRNRYIDTLEQTHRGFDLRPFAEFIKDEMNATR